MNLWKGTAVLKTDPLLFKDNQGNTVLKFTACNTEKVLDENKAVVAKRELWLDCVWKNPSWSKTSLFKARAVVLLEGMLYQHNYTRQDGTEGWSTVLEVVAGAFQKQFPGSAARK